MCVVQYIYRGPFASWQTFVVVIAGCMFDLFLELTALLTVVQWKCALRGLDTDSCVVMTGVVIMPE